MLLITKYLDPNDENKKFLVRAAMQCDHPTEIHTNSHGQIALGYSNDYVPVGIVEEKKAGKSANGGKQIKKHSGTKSGIDTNHEGQYVLNRR